MKVVAEEALEVQRAKVYPAEEALNITDAIQCNGPDEIGKQMRYVLDVTRTPRLQKRLKEHESCTKP